MDFLEPRKQKKVITPGPIESKEGIPYDYIVVIDAGSKGSRVYVYNWLNPVHILQNDIDLNDIADNRELKLVRRFFINSIGGRDNDEDSDLENEDNEENHNTDKEKEKGKEKDKEKSKEKGKDRDKGKYKDKDNKTGKGGDQDKEKDKPKEPENENTRRLPLVGAKKKWNKKIKPGISSFNSSPQKIGNHHLKHLLQLASIVVPKSQHSRTPIFLHSTGGMRLLPPIEQQQILDNICKYITHNSDFFIPECSTHVNVIDGDVEGLYGWLSINYLIGALDNPQNHQHGKNHTTYGLLDMGGASTQVVFQPNFTEIEEHDKNLFKVKLVELPTPISGEQKKEQTGKNEDSIGSFNTPSDLNFDIYSDSFLGFGMYQAHNRYLSFLTEKYTEEHELNKPAYYGRSHTPVPDPCLPKGYTTTSVINDDSVHFTGESDFNKCLTSIFPVLHNSTHNAGSGKDENCKEFKDSDESSSCLLNDLIPAFDFDVNHFVGVSGYWDAITNLLSYEDKSARNLARSSDKKPGGKDAADTYDYKVIYNATSKLCSQSFSRLIELNNVRPEKNQMAEEELSDLCFKSSWILNFLHLGLGFPRFGIDKHATENSRFKSLELVERLGGSSFSWTLGRAILYANDEYVQAFNNFTADTIGLSEEDRITSKTNIPRSGFYHSASSSVFHFGAEQSGIFPRPQFNPPVKDAKYTIFDYETDYQPEYKESKWDIEPHRWYGSLVFISLIGFILWLLMGRSGRAALIDKTKNKLNSIFNLVKGRTGNSSYFRLNNDAGNEGDLELADFELNELSHNLHGTSAEEADNQFKIDSDED